jgi:aminoglycoside phosphotransferase (APT) family kinase protein
MSVTDAEAYRFVAGHHGRRAADIRLPGAGEWSRAYGFVLDRGDLVIRLGDHVEDFRKDQVMAAHGSAALPVPAVVENGAAGDGYFAVSERARGAARWSRRCRDGAAATSACEQARRTSGSAGRTCWCWC